jgi:predicted transcriptional regulator
MNDNMKYKLCAGMKTPPSAKLIYCYLLDVSENGGVILPVKKIAKAVGLSRATAGRSLHRLHRLDMLTISPRYNEDGGRTANKYTVR